MAKCYKCGKSDPVMKCICNDCISHAEKARSDFRDELLKATEKMQETLRKDLEAETDEIKKQVLERLLDETTGFILVIEETYEPDCYNDPEYDINNY